MAWKILVTARAFSEVGQDAIQLLRDADCEVVIPPKFGPIMAEALLPLLKGADAVLASADQYSADVLRSPEVSHLKIISRWGVGFDSVDVHAASQQGIVVTYTPGMLNDTVADYTFALLFSIARRVHDGDASLRRGEWKPPWGDDIFGKTLGIVGCGRIGQVVAHRASGFNFRLLGYDVAPSTEAKKLGIEFIPLEELLALSDFVTLHSALTPQNRGLIGEAQLRKMKKSAYLINTARGGLVDEPALVRALQEGWIAGAALDTFVTEPLPTDHPFRTTPNLLLTPHQAPCGRESAEQVSLTAAQAIVDLMNGHRPKFVIDSAVFDTPSLRAKLRKR